MDIDSSASKADGAFRIQGFSNPDIFQYDDHVLYIYKKFVTKTCNTIQINKSDYVCCVGTLIHENVLSNSALRRIYDIVDNENFSRSGLKGEYCLIIRKNGRIYLMTDEIGIYKVYTDNRQRIFSSSFLSIADLSPSNDINTQTVYEYVFNGATYGDETVFKNIKLIDSGKIYSIDKKIRLEDDSRTFPEASGGDDYNRTCLVELRNYFTSIKNSFGKDVGTALSGGYDSRLALALLLENNIDPWLYVYGRETDSDVIIAKNIARQEGLDLHHIDKSNSEIPQSVDIKQTILENFYFFDGYPAEGIFNNGIDRKTRLDRYKERNLIINGGGGAIFRNFFYLPDKPFNIRQVLWAFYSQFDPAVCSQEFDEGLFHTILGDKIKNALNTKNDTLTRQEVELVFVLFRCRYWMGRNSTINNRLGYSLTPFVDPNIVREALKVPLKDKNYGKFEGRLIRSISPSLASYNSCYGHNFLKDPPLMGKLEEFSVMRRPTLIRRYTYRLRKRLQGNSAPCSHKHRCDSGVMDGGFPYMSRFFNVPYVTDQSHYNRICTLEYLFQHTGPRITHGH